MEEEKKNKIKIAALQMNSVIGDIKKNCEKIEKIINEELSNDSDILILPEVWTVGWSCSNFIKCAEELDNSLSIEKLKKNS